MALADVSRWGNGHDDGPAASDYLLVLDVTFDRYLIRRRDAAEPGSAGGRMGIDCERAGPAGRRRWRRWPAGCVRRSPVAACA